MMVMHTEATSSYAIKWHPDDWDELLLATVTILYDTTGNYQHWVWHAVGYDFIPHFTVWAMPNYDPSTIITYNCYKNIIVGN